MDAAEARFTNLYDAHYRKVLGFLLRRLGCTTTAQDLTEDVFLVAWRKLDAVPMGDEAEYWLYGVARKTLTAHQRKISNRRRIARRWLGGVGERPAQPEEIVVRGEDDRLLDEALDQLRQKDRELIRMAYWDDLPHAAIAQVLGITRGTVDVRLHRAIKRLGKELDRSDHLWVEELRVEAPKESGC